MVEYTHFINKYTLLCSILICFSAFVINNYSVYEISKYLNLYFISIRPNENISNNIFTLDRLAKYNGVDNKRMYLAILGAVFDVTAGRKHYEKGAGYHYFIGKDGTRSFITGNFTDNSEEKDHVIDLTCDDLAVLMNWRDTYKTRYVYRGKLIGRYYDNTGKETKYKEQLNNKLKQCEHEKKMADDLKQKYPSCNVEWTVDSGTRVWCTKNSGGVSRSWIGVPMQLFTLGESSPRCVCVDLSKDNSVAFLKNYKNCAPHSVSCNVIDSD